MKDFLVQLPLEAEFPIDPNLSLSQYPDVTDPIDDLKFKIYHDLTQTNQWGGSSEVIKTLKQKFQPKGAWDVINHPHLPGFDKAGNPQYAVYENKVVHGPFLNTYLAGAGLAATSHWPDFAQESPSPTSSPWNSLPLFPQPEKRLANFSSFPVHQLPSNQQDPVGLISGFLDFNGKDHWKDWDLPPVFNPNQLHANEPLESDPPALRGGTVYDETPGWGSLLRNALNRLGHATAQVLPIALQTASTYAIAKSKLASQLSDDLAASSYLPSYPTPFTQPDSHRDLSQPPTPPVRLQQKTSPLLETLAKNARRQATSARPDFLSHSNPTSALPPVHKPHPEKPSLPVISRGESFLPQNTPETVNKNAPLDTPVLQHNNPPTPQPVRLEGGVQLNQRLTSPPQPAPPKQTLPIPKKPPQPGHGPKEQGPKQPVNKQETLQVQAQALRTLFGPHLFSQHMPDQREVMQLAYIANWIASKTVSNNPFLIHLNQLTPVQKRQLQIAAQLHQLLWENEHRPPATRDDALTFARSLQILIHANTAPNGQVNQAQLIQDLHLFGIDIGYQGNAVGTQLAAWAGFAHSNAAYNLLGGPRLGTIGWKPKYWDFGKQYELVKGKPRLINQAHHFIANFIHGVEALNPLEEQVFKDENYLYDGIINRNPPDIILGKLAINLGRSIRRKKFSWQQLPTIVYREIHQ